MDELDRFLTGLRGLLTRSRKDTELDGEVRATRPSRPLEDLLRDVRYAARRLLKAPGTSAVIVLCLGLGLGATAGVFSFFFGIVLRPLPFAGADRLAILFETAPGFTRASPSLTDFQGWRDNATAFRGLGAYARTSVTLTGPEGPEVLDGTRVSHDLFDVLGAAPALGRGFGPDDDGPGAPPTVVLSHDLWMERYGGARTVLGRTVTLDESPHTVVGVMPEGFAFPEEARFWIPLQTAASPGGGVLTAVLGRYADGVTLDGARADMDRVAAIMRVAYPEANARREIAVRPLEEDFLWGLKTPVTLFLLVAGFVLLLAAANVAHILLAQGTTRVREMVVRTAMGAPRRRILRQLLTESVLLAGAGGGLGLLLGAAGRDLYLSFVPERFPYYLRFDMDAPVLALLLLLTVGMGVLFGLAPALETTRVDLFAALRGGGEGGGSPRRGSGVTPEGGTASRFRGVLMALQTGLALAVLVGAGMMARSLGSLKAVSTGLDPENLLTLRIELPPAYREDPEGQRLAFDEIQARVAAVPGVEDAALVSNLPIAGAAAGTSLSVEGTEAPPPGEEPWVINKQAQPGYFRTAGIRILEGRDFGPEDGRPGSSPVVVVNEAFALRYWADANALGKRVKYGRPDSEYPWMEVVGVAANVRHFGPERPVELGLYEPFHQFPWWRESLMVRTAGDPLDLVRGVINQVRAVDPEIPVSHVFTMEEILYRSYWRPVVLSRLLWIFTGTALILAALGIYGVVAFSTARRRREFGIRMALGADREEVLRAAVRAAVVPCVAGLLGGLGVAWVGIRLARALLYGVESMDPVVALGALAAMGLIALAAVILPARNAAALSPATVLRGE